MSKTYAAAHDLKAEDAVVVDAGGAVVPSWDDIEKESALRAAGPQLNALLRALIRQIEMGDYTDAVGHKLTMNVHFIAAKEAVNSP